MHNSLPYMSNQVILALSSQSLLGLSELLTSRYPIEPTVLLSKLPFRQNSPSWKHCIRSDGERHL